MGKPDHGSAAAEGARRATGDAAGPGRGGRLSVGRKREVVRRLWRGEDLESVSRELGITAARASQGRARCLAAGQASLKSRAPDARNEDDRRRQATIGELLMENEVLYAKVDQLEAGGPWRRAALWSGGGRGDEGRPLDLHASGVRPAADLPGVALRSLQRLRAAAGDNVPRCRVGAAGRSARPRTTSWSATFAGCSKRRPFMAKGTGRPGRSSGSRESALRRNGCAG